MYFEQTYKNREQIKIVHMLLKLIKDLECFFFSHYDILVV